MNYLVVIVILQVGLRILDQQLLYIHKDVWVMTHEHDSALLWHVKGTHCWVGMQLGIAVCKPLSNANLNIRVLTKQLGILSSV